MPGCANNCKCRPNRDHGRPRRRPITVPPALHGPLHARASQLAPKITRWRLIRGHQGSSSWGAEPQVAARGWRQPCVEPPTGFEPVTYALREARHTPQGVLPAQTASLVSRNAHDAQRARTGYPKGPGTEVQHGCPWPDAGSAPEEPACQARPPVGVLPASGMSQGRYPCVRSESPPGDAVQDRWPAMRLPAFLPCLWSLCRRSGRW